MPNKSKQSSKSDNKTYRPATTPEARENQMISLAIDVAEQQLRDGTASSGVIVHFLKLGSTKERLEKDILSKQKDLIDAKTKAIKATEDNGEKYTNAIKAMQIYSGHFNETEYDENEDIDI